MTDKKFADYLVKGGLIQPGVLKDALDRQSLVGRRLDTVLLDMDLMTEGSILDALGKFHRKETVSALTLGTIDADTPHMIPSRMAARYEVIPYHLDGKRLSIATLNPDDLLVEDELNFITGCVVLLGVALEVRMYQALAKHYGIDRTPLMISVCKRLASGRPARRRRAKRKEPFPTPHDYIADAARQTGRPPDQLAREAGLDPSALSPPAPVSADVELKAPAIAPEVQSTTEVPGPPPQQPVGPPPAMRSRRQQPAEVELSDDDLALFPSLSVEGEAPAEAAAEAEVPPEAAEQAPSAPKGPPQEAAPPQFEEVTEEEAPAKTEASPQFEEVPEEDASPQAEAEAAPEFEEVTEPAPEEAAAELEEVPEEEGEEYEEEYLTEEDLEPAPVVELTPARRLAIASEALQNAEMREDIGDAMLGFCEPYMRRRMLLAMRKDTIIGWRGEGEGVDETAVRAISIPKGEPSVFLGLTQGMSFWMAALPPMPRNSELVLALGGPDPKDCLILPVTLRDRVVCFLYGDNMDESISGAPVGDLRRLASKASLAFQVYLLKNKIRVM